MKKQIVQTLIVLAGLTFLSNPLNASVVGSRHDFTETGESQFQGTVQEVCVYCHTPHGGAGRDRAGNRLPLWNRTTNEYTANYFTMYSSPTFDGDYTDGKPTGTSLLCLSCHDGVATLAGVTNQPYGQTITFNFPSLGAFGNPADLGKDLSNDHPISFEYNPTLVTDDTTRRGFKALQDPDLINSALKLTGASGLRLECTTCHDVHEYGMDPEGILEAKVPFLRMSNTGSAMCRSCHFAI